MLKRKDRAIYKRLFYISLFLSIILFVNFLSNKGIIERFLFLGKKKDFRYEDIFFKIPKDFPLPICEGDKQKGSIKFFEEFHPGRYNWYLVIAWDENDFEWKNLLPPLKKFAEARFEPKYDFGQTYEKKVRVFGKEDTYRLIYTWITRPCGISDNIFLFLYEFERPPRFFKIMNFSDKKRKKVEKEFRRFLSSLRIVER